MSEWVGEIYFSTVKILAQRPTYISAVAIVLLIVLRERERQRERINTATRRQRRRRNHCAVHQKGCIVINAG